MSTLVVVVLVISNVIWYTHAGGCITGIDVFAGTGGIKDAQSDADFMFEFHYTTDKKYVSNFELYDRPGDDMQKDQGDLWTLGGPEQCATSADLGSDNYIKPWSGRNGWYIQDAIVYGELDDDKQDLILISHNYGVNSWADYSLTPPDSNVDLPTKFIEHDNCKAKDQCITNIYVMANTGDDKADGSNDSPQFVLNEYYFYLPDLPGDDMKQHKADLWKVSAEDAGITGCLKFGSVNKAAFHSKGYDGWGIKNAIVTVQLDSGNYALLAGNRDWNKWIDDYNTVSMTLKNAC